MRRIVAITFLQFIFVYCNPLFGQEGLCFWWRCPSGDTVFNFNPSQTVNPGNTLTFDSIPFSTDYTLIIAYQTKSSSESTLWHLDFGGRGSRSLTSQRLLVGNTEFHYIDTTDTRPIINTLRQSAPDSASSLSLLTLGSDTMQGNFIVSELIYFNRRLGIGELRRIQGPLAIRYGVTLGPVDYRDGQGNIFWHNVEAYRHRITGVGREKTWALYQSHSRSQEAGAMLTISTDTLDEKDFLVCGDNDGALAFADTDGMEILQRQWRAELTGNPEHLFSLEFDIQDIEGLTDSIILLVDNNLFRPSFVSTNRIRFDNVYFPSDTSHFTLGRGSLLWQLSEPVAKHANNTTHTNNRVNSTIHCQLYPNPTHGEYTLEVDDAQWIEVIIYNTVGEVVKTFSESNKRYYNISGTLPTGNVYYVNVVTDSGNKTIKLVVK